MLTIKYKWSYPHFLHGFTAGASNLFQPPAKFAVPKLWQAKSLSCFLPKSRRRPKKKGLPSDLISAFCQKQDEEKK